MNLFSQSTVLIRRRFELILCMGLSLFSNIQAQSVSEAQASARSDLESSIRRLANIRTTIAAEKVQLSNLANEAKEKASLKRNELKRLQRLEDNAALSLEKIREDNEKLEKDLTYVSSLFRDYAQEFDVSLDIAEKSVYQPSLEKLYNSRSVDVQNPTLASQAQEIRFLQTALTRLSDVIGGHQFPSSSVLGPDGEILAGECLLIGPYSYFAGNGGEAGIIQTDKGPPIRPRLQPLQANQSKAIQAYIDDGQGVLPFDPTLQEALQVQVADKSFFEEIKAGGLWIWPILLFAITSFIGALIKAYEVYTMHNPKPETLEKILEHLHAEDPAGATQLVSELKGPFRPLLENAIEYSHARKELLEEILFEKILEAQPTLEKFLPFIAVTAAATPLLGLLGTVTGMIHTFDQITLYGTSDAGKLAGGISEALVTTKFGLIAAIPALILHALLSRRVQGLLASMEKFSSAFINGLQTKGI